MDIKIPRIDPTYCNTCEKETLSVDNSDRTCFKCSECGATK